MNEERFAGSSETFVRRRDSIVCVLIVVHDERGGKMEYFHSSGLLTHIRASAKEEIRVEVCSPKPAYHTVFLGGELKERYVWTGTYDDVFQRVPCVYEYERRVKNGEQQEMFCLRVNGKIISGDDPSQKVDFENAMRQFKAVEWQAPNQAEYQHVAKGNL